MPGINLFKANLQKKVREVGFQRIAVTQLCIICPRQNCIVGGVFMRCQYWFFWSATPQTTRIGIFVAGNAAFELDESSQTSDDEGLVTFTLDGKQAC